MKKGILATKVGMTQIFNENGVLTPVTVLQAGPCYVTQVKTVDNDGYSAVQVGFVDKKDKIISKDATGKKEVKRIHGVNKPLQGHFAKAGVSGKRYLKEFKFENAEEYELGQEIKADIFEAGDKVDVSGTSKGKGFQGAIKRHGLHRGPMAHGSKFHRHAGSNGACSDPSRVFKGKKMPGQMGAVKVTVQNLEIVRVDAEQNLILVKGAVPGPMANVSVYNMEGSEVGKMDLSDNVFAAKVNEHLMHMAVVLQLANKRQGTQKAKTRSEVRGGGKKPWRQKGTGHARQGSIRAPQWTGGGVVFAPTPRDYSFKMNKKEKRSAIKSALTSRVNEEKFKVMDSLKFDEIKTKKMVGVLNALKVNKALVVLDGEDNANVELSARNIAGVRVVPFNAISVYDILKYDTVVITKRAVSKIEEVYA